MNRWFSIRAILALVLAAGLSYAALALPFGHGGGTTIAPPVGDPFQAARDTACGGNTALHNCWFTVGGQAGVTKTTLSAVYQSPNPCTTSGVNCGGGQSDILDAWSGCALDDLNHIFACNGGGHFNYCGSELYAIFLSVSLDWTLPFRSVLCPQGKSQGDPGFDQYPGTSNNTCFAANGTTSIDCLAAMHTYGGLTSMYGFGSITRVTGAQYPSGATSSFVWNWNTTATTVSNKYDNEIGGGDYGEEAVWDPNGHKLYVVGGGINGVKILDPTALATHQWTYPNVDSPFTCGGPYCSAAWDQAHSVVWVVGQGTGSGQLYSFTAGGVRSIKTISGNTACNADNAPGLGYRPSDHKLYCFRSGETATYTLDTDACNTSATNCVWVKVNANASNTGSACTLTAGNQGGFFTKMQYSAFYDAFICVGGTTAMAVGYRP